MIGYRFMGKAHSNAWRQAPHFFPLKAGIEMRTICGRDAAAVEAARVQFGWQQTSTDWREVVNSPDIDIVDINTPNDSHAEIAIAAARAGKHVMCEKPLALTVKQCEAMVAAAKKAGVVNMVCHNYRRIPAIAQAKKMIEEGAIGQVYHYYARYAQDWIVNPDFPLVWRLQKGISGSGKPTATSTPTSLTLSVIWSANMKTFPRLMHIAHSAERPLMESGGAKVQGPSAKSGQKDGARSRWMTRPCSWDVRNHGALANLEAACLAHWSQERRLRLRLLARTGISRASISQYYEPPQVF